jgi:hypothetical protein
MGELGGPGRVACGSGADSMLQFWVERGGDGIVLLEYELEAASSSWLNEKEV